MSSQAITRFRLARAWQGKGSAAPAMAGYREVLALEPDNLDAALLLGGLLQEHQRLDEAAEVYRQAIERHPIEAQLHKQFVNVMLLQQDADELFRYYRLDRQDSKITMPGPAEILCVTALKNEIVRLPYFLDYYRGKGIGAFLAVDNGSTDGSLEYLLDQPDVYLWRSDLTFLQQANSGASWFEVILRHFGQGHWCVTVDADELLYYPGCEDSSVVDLCRELDRKKKRALNAILLDMYADVPVRDAHYAPGRRFEDVCPYFDRTFYHKSFENAGPFKNQTCYFGGVRQRIFGEAGEYYLSKVPLLKYGADCILAGGQHFTNLPPDQIASESGCLLHFKYFSSFPAYVSRETENREMQYQEYERRLSQDPSVGFYDSDHSIRLKDSAQLVRLGVMRIDASQEQTPGEEFHDQEPQGDEAPVYESANPPSSIQTAATQILPSPVQVPSLPFSKIDSVPATDQRPEWSVMLTVYRRTVHLAQALASVLAQAPGPQEMQIEVICDGPEDAIQDEIRRIIHSLAGNRVAFHPRPHHAGHPEIFNFALRRARGRWVHLLHDDDWIAPGFYAALSEASRRAPEIGMAFCRHSYVDESGRHLRLSFLERETAGTIEGWLDRIGVFCRLQTPSVVVRREVYERLGGYSKQARSAFDWEMWQRIAVHYPVWFEPRPLAFFREAGGSESHQLIASGEQIADARAVLEVCRTYLPRALAGRLGRRSGEHHALRALDLARRYLEAGDHRAAMSNLLEGIRCSRSEEVSSQIRSLLSRARQAD